MKRFLLSLAFCCFQAYAIVPALVNKAVNSAASGSSIAISATSATAGNTLVVYVYANDVTHLVKSITDTATNTFYLVDRRYQAGVGSISMWVFVARNILGNGSNVVTATFSGSVSLPRIFVNQYSGVATVYPIDGVNTARTNGTTVSTTLTTSYANSVVIGCLGSWGAASATLTPSGSFTMENTDGSIYSGIEDQIFSSTQTGLTVGGTFSTGAEIIVIALTLVGTGQSPTYTYIVPLTTDHTKVGTVSNTDQANFPLLINHTYANLATVANGGQIQNTVTNANGVVIPADFAYSTDPNCANTLDSTGLDFELEAWSATTGLNASDVSIASLSHSTDNKIYQCFGSCAVKNSPSIGSAVWQNDGHYVVVLHYSTIQGNCNGQGNGNSGLPLADSTNNSHSVCFNTGGSLYPTNSAGQIANGLNFTVGINTGFSPLSSNGGTVNLPTGTNVWTLESWVNIASGAAVGSIFGWGVNTTGRECQLFWNNDSKETTACFAASATAAFTADSNWHQWTAVLPSGTTTNSIQLYKDGASVTTTGDGVTINQADTDLTIGVSPNTNSNQYSSKLDESRISNVARSADWIKTEYNNQSSPLTFYTIGTLTINGAAICPGITGGHRPFAYISELFPLEIEFPWAQTCTQTTLQPSL